MSDSNAVSDPTRVSESSLASDSNSVSGTSAAAGYPLTGGEAISPRPDLPRAEDMDREAQDKYSQVMGQLTEQRTTLEKKIDDLRVYEREYRSRLKSWITDQLSQLDEGGANEGAQPVAQGAK